MSLASDLSSVIMKVVTRAVQVVSCGRVGVTCVPMAKVSHLYSFGEEKAGLTWQIAWFSFPNPAKSPRNWKLLRTGTVGVAASGIVRHFTGYRGIFGVTLAKNSLGYSVSWHNVQQKTRASSSALSACYYFNRVSCWMQNGNVSVSTECECA